MTATNPAFVRLHDALLPLIEIAACIDRD